MKKSVTVRLCVMAMLLLGLMIPLTMIHSVVRERSSRRLGAAAEISGTWGGAQTLGGPVLVLPYRWEYTDDKGRVHHDIRRAFLLPESLDIEGTVTPGIRTRGVFDVIVYDAHLRVRGSFSRADMSRLGPGAEQILWDAATLSVGVSDPKGIAKSARILWNGRTEQFVPGVTDAGLFASGLQAPAPGLSTPADTAIPFEFEIDLRGTRELRFLPAGNETTVRLTSSWQHPSFSGAALPESRSVSGSGFTASWRVPYFGRGFPPRWMAAGSNHEQLRSQASASAFGVALVQPVDIYLQSERAVKYAALFIVLTFVIAFLWEVTGAVLVHPVQYLFVGFAMCIFYLLLVSLAEHTGFDVAFGTASIATIGLIAWYWSWVLHGARQGAMMTVALTTLYGYLYLLLRLEDFALLAGSLGLFAMLALFMFMTRRVDWYALRLGDGPAGLGA